MDDGRALRVFRSKTATGPALQLFLYSPDGMHKNQKVQTHLKHYPGEDEEQAQRAIKLLEKLAGMLARGAITAEQLSQARDDELKALGYLKTPARKKPSSAAGEKKISKKPSASADEHAEDLDIDGQALDDAPADSDDAPCTPPPRQKFTSQATRATQHLLERYVAMNVFRFLGY